MLTWLHWPLEAHVVRDRAEGTSETASYLSPATPSEATEAPASQHADSPSRPKSHPVHAGTMAQSMEKYGSWASLEQWGGGITRTTQHPDTLRLGSHLALNFNSPFVSCSHL